MVNCERCKKRVRVVEVNVYPADDITKGIRYSLCTVCNKGLDKHDWNVDKEWAK